MRPKGRRGQWKSHKNQRFNQNYQSQNQSQNHQVQEYLHCDQLSEKDVGITEYLSNLDGFTGVIKARYSDFQLNEIDLDGNIAKLTNTDIPKDFELKMVQCSYKEVAESPNKHITQQVWESLKNIVDGSNEESIMLDAEVIDKDSRKEIHHCIKSHFGRKIIASTVEQEGKKFIKFEKFRKVMVDTRVQWPDDKGEYVYFIVYKEKMDTLAAIFKISTALNIGQSQFAHAGTKDRRSISSQWFSVKKIEPWKLIVKTRHLSNIRIGNITFKDTPLKLGHLKGNKFRIALRNVTAEDLIINNSLNHLKEEHFINYYGLQRFGNDKEVPTYQVGISLLKGKWKEAVELILKPKSSDSPHSAHSDVVEAKKIYAETGDAAKAYAALQLNKSKSVEGKLLEGLKYTNKNEYVNALERVPRQMRLLYLHAFQSLIWNRMVSKRLQLFGTKPVVGDFVLLNESEETVPDENLDTKELETKSTKDENVTEIKCRQQVKCLCENDLDNYSIFDIVLPLPGYDIMYPEHMKTYYKESIEEYELDLEMTKQKVKSYTLSGNYRKILGKIDNLTWKIVRYNNPVDNLILSDLQELKGESELQTDENGKYKAVVMEFSLSACSYATMVLREIMKIDTSSNVHSKLNNYHDSEQEKKLSSKLENTDGETQKNEQEEDMSQANSLLADPAKYESFKNSIFSAIGQKRSGPDEQEESKRQKIEEEISVKTE